MTNGIHPKLLPQENWLNDLLLTFDHMVQRGNVMANLRKTEIQELDRVRWNRQVRPERFSAASNASAGLSQVSPASSGIPHLGDPFFDQWGTNDGLSGAQLVNLADALNFTTDIDLLSL